MAAAANFEFPTAVPEPMTPALAADQTETPSAAQCPSKTPSQDQLPIDPALLSVELDPLWIFTKQNSIKPTIATEPKQVNSGKGSPSGEERHEPETAPIMAPKSRKSAKNPTPAMIENSRVRAIAAEKAANRRADPRSPNEIYGTEGLVTAESHPHTFSLRFAEPGLAMAADYMGVRGFQNCLENYIAAESPEKQRSSHRSAETLQRIKEMNPIPPPHYPRDDPQTCANWKHEIGYPVEGKQKRSPKWVIRDDKVYKFVEKRGDKVVEEFPESPTEEWYALLTTHHFNFGHRGRDVVYNYVKSITPSISKGFIAEYVSNCCLQGVASVRKSKKRVIEEVGSTAPAPAAKKPKSHSTEPAMVNAGDEQDSSLQQENSSLKRKQKRTTRKGKEIENATAGPSTMANLTNGDNTCHPQLNNAFAPGLEMDPVAGRANGDNTSLQQFEDAFALGLTMYPELNEEISWNLAPEASAQNLQPVQPDSLVDDEPFVLWQESYFDDNMLISDVDFDWFN